MRGFTLPVWVVAAAKAAGQVLIGQDLRINQTIDFSDNQESIIVPIRSAALFNNSRKAIGISHCEPGEGLDITRDLEIWVCLEYIKNDQMMDSESPELPSDSWMKIVPGHGVGKLSFNNQISISEFARALLSFNLQFLRKAGHHLQIEIIFPCGRELAVRTSNHAFGVVDGLALIGTQANVQTSASPEHLQKIINYLKKKCSEPSFSGILTFVIGENGLDLALKKGLNAFEIVKTGNWLGPLLVEAAQQGVRRLLIFGYHGKLIKLAGGVFHTHHHLADNRMETLIALAVKEGISLPLIKSFENAMSLEEALLILENKDISSATRLWQRLSVEVETRSVAYVNRYLSTSMTIGAAMFDRKRKLRWAGEDGLEIISSFGLRLED